MTVTPRGQAGAARVAQPGDGAAVTREACAEVTGGGGRAGRRGDGRPTRMARRERGKPASGESRLEVTAPTKNRDRSASAVLNHRSAAQTPRVRGIFRLSHIHRVTFNGNVHTFNFQRATATFPPSTCNLRTIPRLTPDTPALPPASRRSGGLPQHADRSSRGTPPVAGRRSIRHRRP